MKSNGGLITSIEPGGLAEVAGLRPGDTLQAINGFEIHDLIDYRYQIAEENVTLRVLRGEETLEVTLTKEIDEDLGLEFQDAVFDRIRPCANNCVFCFIHQQPSGMRESLYVMDDDYRLSFLQGNFITMTNMPEREWKRIEELRLSPLYVSVHTSNPELRAQILKQPLAKRIHQHLGRLTDAGIQFHAQVVLIPGVNDGAELDRTIEELAERYLPDLLSINIVPVALNRFREELGLPDLKAPTPEWCAEVIAQVKPWQKRFKKEWDDPVVQLSDEFYVLSGVPLPKASHYGDFDTVQDGVGGAVLLGWEWKKLAKKLPTRIAEPMSVQIVTGKAAAHIVQPLIDDLEKVENLDAELVPTPSRFWGELITVTGLLTGQDLIDEPRLQAGVGEIWIPDIMLKAGTEIFLDDKSVSEVAKALDRPIRIMPTTAQGLFDMVAGTRKASREDTRARFGNYEPAAAATRPRLA
ncbi:Radical SAM superfamily protein [compost metagenome]